MSLQFDYNLAENPAMPVAAIDVWYASEATKVTLTAIVDSGADATFIPIRVLQQVHARKARRARLRTPVGTPIQVDLYVVSLGIGDLFRRHVQVIAYPRNQETIIGRDVLNQLIVTLNGLAAVVEISA